jgi:uncharacterized membrane protein (TIGR02234 family)
VIVAYGATWVTATVPVFAGGGGDGTTAPTRVEQLTGSMLFGFGAAAGWLALASVAGIIATRSWLRVGVGVVAVVAGAAAGVPAVGFILSRAPLIEQALDTDQIISSESNAWWLVAVAGGLAVMAAGLFTAVYGRAWPTLSARYDRAPSRSETATPTGDGVLSGSLELWDALDRGEDPTREGREKETG